MPSDPELVIAGDEPYGLYVTDTRNLKDVLDSQFDEGADGLVDATITSPPYADVKNYEADEDVQVGFGQSYDDYLEDLRDVYGQVYDVTSDDGTLWVVVNTVKKDQRVVRLPFDIADACENLHGVERCRECDDRLVKNRETGELECERCGWTHDPLQESWRLQDVVVWNKSRARPWSREGQFRNVFEYILCFSKRPRDFQFDLDSIRVPDTEQFKEWWVKYPERYNPRGKVPHNIWEFTTPTQGSWGGGEIDHPAPFPPDMVERMVNVATEPGDTVLDPFAGTGIVLAQAEAMGRNPLGFELSEDYADIYRQRRESRLDEWDGDDGDEMRRCLERVICKLRQLKFPRELTRRVRKHLEVDTLEELGVNTMFQLSHEVVDREKFDDDNLLMEDDLHIVVDDGTDEAWRDRIRDAAEICANRAPCSKFGIKANINVHTTSEMGALFDDWDWPDDLNLYDRDTYNTPAAVITPSEWIERVRPETQWRHGHAKNDYPPIVSNLTVDVPNPQNRDDPVAIDEVADDRRSSGTGRTTLTDF